MTTTADRAFEGQLPGTPEYRRVVAALVAAGALLRMGRRALSDPGLLALYAVGGCSVGALVAVFNTLGFRLTGAPFHLGLGAASLVLFTYYLGSSAFGSLGGRAWTVAGRPGVAALPTALLLVAALLAQRLRHTPTLLEQPGHANSDCPTYSPAFRPGGTANSAEPVVLRYSMSASFLAMAFWTGMKPVRGSRT